jgi:4'-phosphopantetheinyl transferase
VSVPGALPVPAPGEIQVWWSRVDAGRLPEPVRERLRADVDPARLEKLARFRLPADRDRGLAGHALLRRVLAGMTGARPAALRFGVHCPACDSDEHGKPYLLGADGAAIPQFNLSHSGPVVAVGLTMGRPVGIDVEAARQVDWTTLRRSVFADAEWAATQDAPEPDRLRTQLWSRKEAAVKASGHGLALPLKGVGVYGASAAGPAAGPAWATRLPEGAGLAWGRDLDLGADVGAAVAVHDVSSAPADPVTGVSVLFVTI